MTLPISIRYFSVLSLLLAVSLVAGCASKGDSRETEAAAPAGPSLLAQGKSIANVSVSLASELPADATAAAEQYEVKSRLDSQLREKGSIADGGNLDVEISVVGMRLRTNGAAIWLGVMAGVDWITVDVNVLENGSVVKTFQSNTSTSLGGFGFGGRTARVDRMVNDLSNKVLASI